MRPFLLGIVVLAACPPETSSPDADELSLGEQAYRKCYSCHALEPARNDLAGPTLHNIVGRPVAAEPDFDYSPALRRLAEREPRWTEALIDRFSDDPEAVAPGTTMTFHGIDDAEERRALVAFLKHQTRASAASLP